MTSKGKLIFVGLISMLLFSGCAQKEAVIETKANEVSESEVVTIEKSNLEESKWTEAESEERLASLLSGDDINPEKISKYIDENITHLDKVSCGRFLVAFNDRMRSDIGKYINDFYSDEYVSIHEDINKALISSEYFKGTEIVGKEKWSWIEQVKNEKSKAMILNIFTNGYGLTSGEGTYYPVIDYVEMKEKYGDYVPMEFYQFMTLYEEELLNPTTIEEYLAVDFETLGKRVISYELFIKDYPDFYYVDDIRMLYMGSMWKILNPNIFDNTLNEDFSVKEEMKDIYDMILDYDGELMSKYVVSKLKDFIDSKDGIVGSLNNMDEMLNKSYELHEEVGKLIDTKYFGK